MRANPQVNKNQDQDHKSQAHDSQNHDIHGDNIQNQNQENKYKHDNNHKDNHKYNHEDKSKNNILLDIRNLTVQFGTEKRPFNAVDNLNLSILENEVVGIVGESGSGKSITALAIMGLVDHPGRVFADQMQFNGIELQQLTLKERRKLLGKEIGLIFQDPMTSLDPCFTVGYQIMETLKTHEGGSAKARKQRTLDLLEQVGIPDSKNRLNTYPHQLSGGMSQRVVIAMAIACSPRLLIADEPTTALDVTIQSQIMSLLRDIQEERKMGLMLITHDLAVVAENCQKIVVMYAGQVVETGTVAAVFENPQHPYTQALLKALPERAEGAARLHSIAGVVPGAYDRPTGCLFNPRCSDCQPLCIEEAPNIRNIVYPNLQTLQTLQTPETQQVRCHFPLGLRGDK